MSAFRFDRVDECLGVLLSYRSRPPALDDRCSCWGQLQSEFSEGSANITEGRLANVFGWIRKS